MAKREQQLILGFAIAVIIALLVTGSLFAGWFVVLPALTATTTTTISTTTTTESTPTTASTETTSTSTTTTLPTSTTLRTFYVCEKELKRTENVQTRCTSKTSKELSNSTFISEVEYVLNNTQLGVHEFDYAVVAEDTCFYNARRVSFTAGSFSSCEIPKRNCTIKAELVSE